MNIEELEKKFHAGPATVVVVGSINLDLNSFVETFPLPHQTIRAKDSNLSAGGKGFNQAVAAARAGATVYFVGCIGDDLSGLTAVKTLQENGVNTDFIKKISDVHTGTANILVADGGANMIAVSAGANKELKVEDVIRAKAVIAQADVLVCQLECPLDVVEFALQTARSQGVVTVLNPAPAAEDVSQHLSLTDYVTPNELEALEITGFDPAQPSQRHVAAEKLKSLGSLGSVITLGDVGAYLSDKKGKHYMLNAYSVDAINSTGAGDIFNGAFSCGLSRGYSLVEAAVYASAASAISVTAKSTYDSAPIHSQIIQFIDQQGDYSCDLLQENEL